jgi:hypothetical protein
MHVLYECGWNDKPQVRKNFLTSISMTDLWLNNCRLQHKESRRIQAGKSLVFRFARQCLKITLSSMWRGAVDWIFMTFLRILLPPVPGKAASYRRRRPSSNSSKVKNLCSLAENYIINLRTDMSSVDVWTTHRELSSVRILRNFYLILKYNKTSTWIK